MPLKVLRQLIIASVALARAGRVRLIREEITVSTQPQASGRLKACKERIITEWEIRVRQNVQSTRGHDRTELRNSLPEVLSVMVNTLADPNPKEALFGKERLLAANHGKTRAKDPNYSLDQVIDEYHILFRVIFEVLEEDGQELTQHERNLILDVVLISIKNAATEFKEAKDREKEEVQKNLNQANIALEEALGKKSSEAVLKDRLLKTIYERVEDYAIFSLDAEGKVTSWSDGCRRIKQYTSDEVIGKYYALLYPPEGRVRDEPGKHLSIAASEGRFRGEGLRMRKNGDLFLADVLITPMYDNEELVGYFKIVADLTERNRIIQERDLSRTQVEILKIENALREQFIYMLSHDLRSPLSVAKMGAEIIARQPCGIEAHEDIARRCVSNLARIDNMIIDLLDASRIKEGEPFPLKIAKFDLAGLVNEIRDELAGSVGDRLAVEAPARLHGYWDAGGLRRAIENLVRNAAKFGDPQGKVTIALIEAEDRVMIKIHNFGLPINKEDQESLFELFRQAEAAERGSDRGWGLGLTLVRGITEAHGGIVKVRSLPKEGTTFVLDVPRDARNAGLKE